MQNILNFKHLRYFWVVAKSGSIARASEQLHLTPQSISGQLRELEDNLGVELFHRVGRGLVLSEAGQRILSYAEEIFSLGDELVFAAKNKQSQSSMPFTIGVSDSVPKSITYRLLEPSLQLDNPVRLVCREGRLTALLAELAVHRLDIVIADRPMPNNLHVKGYSHLLGECSLTVFAEKELLSKHKGAFPALLDRAPFLLPGEDFAIQPYLLQWFSEQQIQPCIVGEFDDSALLKAFGRAGAGFFTAPTVIADYVCKQFDVEVVGNIASIRQQFFAITTARKLTHPAIVAICDLARQKLFCDPNVTDSLTD